MLPNPHDAPALLAQSAIDPAVASLAAFVKEINAPERSARRQNRNAVSAPLPAQCSPAAESGDSEADSSEEALAPEDFPQRDTRPANLDERNAAARAMPISHRQTLPAFVPV
ncbi:MAG: hypothetical protein Q7R45_17410 [Sulfuricaulis sp.]|nr:hypothetical protein [Sulfuricaulis sp.]